MDSKKGNLTLIPIHSQPMIMYSKVILYNKHKCVSFSVLYSWFYGPSHKLISDRNISMFSFCLVAVDTDSAHVTLLTHCAAPSDVLCSSSSHRLQTEAAKSLLAPSPFPSSLQNNRPGNHLF